MVTGIGGQVEAGEQGQEDQDAERHRLDRPQPRIAGPADIGTAPDDGPNSATSSSSQGIGLALVSAPARSRSPSPPPTTRPRAPITTPARTCAPVRPDHRVDHERDSSVPTYRPAGTARGRLRLSAGRTGDQAAGSRRAAVGCTRPSGGRSPPGRRRTRPPAPCSGRARGRDLLRAEQIVGDVEDADTVGDDQVVQQVEDLGRMDMSRLAIGSSAMISSGREARARAITTRCRWPPDSSYGTGAGLRPGVGPTISNSSSTRSSTALPRIPSSSGPAG